MRQRRALNKKLPNLASSIRACGSWGKKPSTKRWVKAQASRAQRREDQKLEEGWEQDENP